MSPRMRTDMKIALPPGLTPTLTLGGPSSPCTPLPHTPLPYALPVAQSLRAQLAGSDAKDENIVEVGQKRVRDDEDEAIEPEWTADEVEQLQSTLIHPFRPLSTQYPPGELPPKEALDELTNQVLLYAFRPTGPKRAPHRPHAATAPIPSSPSPGPSPPTALPAAERGGPRGAADRESHREGWQHSWDATRRKLFDLALADSKFGQDEKERKMSRAERQARPGLRRVDSMDFLDQSDEKAGETTPGRAMRLSTSLQNSAKQEPLFIMSRSPSASSTIGSPALSRSSSATSAMSTPNLAAITLTPPSPQPAATSAIPAPLAQPSRRRTSSRSSSGQTRPPRPSLLQRGRSFTASDLQEEADAQAQAQALDATSPTPPHASPIKEEGDIAMTASPSSLSPTTPTSPSTSLAVTATSNHVPRITRSQSSTFFTDHPAHAARDAFLSHPPSTSDRSILAVPLTLGVGGESRQNASSGWSDSEDEGPKVARAMKKMKGGAARKAMVLKLGNVLEDPGMGLGDSLRSPFEEKAEISF